MIPTDLCLFVLKYRIIFDYYTTEAATLHWNNSTMDMKIFLQVRVVHVLKCFLIIMCFV